ncbi:quinone oxidoreductase family protein [Saccharothrix deserti]|uniref:quinone oxidoreductase family protein n=1 Tax=Saccharothrix deserti TaxID=2593674 RepID=UPI00131C1FF2|nr:zinc-binding dehydrogenase [Saccharothrix deserti]
MRAWGFKANGGPEVFEWIERPTPQPGPGQVLIEVGHAGLNFAEVQHRRGEFGAPDGADGYDVPGLEVAGTIAAVGDGVGGLAVGDAVAAYLPSFGGYAEHVLAEAAFTRRTDGLPSAVAAGVPCVYPTAYGVLFDAARLTAGETVLIHAATGGVGSAAARVARLAGAAAVFGTVGSPGKQALAAELGYDALFRREDFGDVLLDATSGRGVDIVLDPVGGRVRRQSLDVLAPFGRVVVYGDLARDPDWTVDAWDLWKHNKSLAGYSIRDLSRRDPARLGDYLARALAELASGELRHERPTVAPVADVRDVHRRFEGGDTSGKTVFSFA